MKAPSEKHLQDYLYNNPECFHEESELDYSDPIDLFGYEYELPRGRVDLLGSGWIDGWNCIWAIELKKDALALPCLAQVLRYVRDIQLIWEYAISGLHDINEALIGVDHRPQVRGILVGYSCSDDLLIAAQASNVCVYTYSYNADTTYTLTPQIPKDPHKTALLRYYDSNLGEEIRRVHTVILKSLTQYSGIDWTGKYVNMPINDLWKIYGGES